MRKRRRRHSVAALCKVGVAESSRKQTPERLGGGPTEPDADRIVAADARAMTDVDLLEGTWKEFSFRPGCLSVSAPSSNARCMSLRRWFPELVPGWGGGWLFRQSRILRNKAATHARRGFSECFDFSVLGLPARKVRESEATNSPHGGSVAAW